MRFFSEKYRLTAWLILILAVGFVTTSLTSYYFSSKQVKDNIINQQLPLSSDNIYSEIQRDLIDKINVSRQMAHDTFLQDWVLAGEQDQSKIVQYLAAIKQQFGANTAFLVTEPKHHYYYAEGFLGTIKEGDPEHKWFFDFKNSDRHYAVESDTDKAHARQLTTFINFKVFDKNQQFIGVTGVGLNVDTIDRLIKRYEQTYQRRVYFVDSAGNVMLSSDTAKSNIFRMPGISAIGAQMINAEKLPKRLAYELPDGKIVQLNSRYVPELKWYLVVEQNESEAVLPLRKILFGNLGVSFFALCLVAALTLYTVNKYQLRLQTMATQDQLTGLSNRAMGELLLDQSISDTRRYHKPLSVILLDIDHFKNINDQFGHHVGDTVLSAFGAFLKTHGRQNDIMARWGGEEFLIVMNDCAGQDAIEFCQKLNEKIMHMHFEPLPKSHRVTASFGVAELGPDDIRHDLLVKADMAMYQAKNQGRNQVAFKA